MPSSEASLAEGSLAEAAPARALVPVLILVATVTSAIGSLGAPLLDTIARVDHVSVGNAQWSLTLPMLVGAVFAPTLGRLGDGPARRAVILSVLAGVLAGCVVAALPHGGFVLLLVGRGMQGLGFALIPLTMAQVRDSLPDWRSPSAIAMLSVSGSAGIGLGYPITSILDDTLGLNAPFWFGAVVAAVALLLCAMVLPPSKQRQHRPLDAPGASLIGASLFSLLLAVTEAHAWGWGSARVVSLLAASGLLGWLWTRRERSTAHPLVDLQLLRHRTVAVTNVAGLILALAAYMFLPLLSDFVQIPRSAGYGFGSSVVVAGLLLVPFSVLSTSMGGLATVMSRRFGPERVLPIGGLLMAIASGLFALTGGALWEAFLAISIAGMGFGIGFAVIPGLIIRSVPPEETGSAMAFSSVTRFVGFALGSGIGASILATYTEAGHQLPGRSGFTVAMGAGAVAALLAAVVASRLGGPQASGPPERYLSTPPAAVPQVAAAESNIG